MEPGASKPSRLKEKASESSDGQEGRDLNRSKAKQPNEVDEPSKCSCELPTNELDHRAHQVYGNQYYCSLNGLYGQSIYLPIPQACFLFNDPTRHSQLFASVSQIDAPRTSDRTLYQPFGSRTMDFAARNVLQFSPTSNFYQPILPTISCNDSQQAISYCPTTSIQHHLNPPVFYLIHHYQPSSFAWHANSNFAYPYPWPANNLYGETSMIPLVPNICQPISTINDYTSQIEMTYGNSPYVSSWLDEQRQMSTSHLISLLPVEAQPTLTKQAYGMDKVWEDEFELLFGRFDPNIVWRLIEVESNPRILDSDNIIDHRVHYKIRISDSSWKAAQAKSVPEDGNTYFEDQQVLPPKSLSETNRAPEDYESIGVHEGSSSPCDSDISLDESECRDSSESDARCESNACEIVTDSTSTSGISSSEENQTDEPNLGESEPQIDVEKSSNLRNHSHRRFPLRFRMFIDSAKVRFCCDECGHGWTSMKGRVVFWYELFELESQDQDTGEANQMLGFCAYKLFGQQCDICKIENRFERPMWYPEEVVKVLNNLSNKLGQVYFGLRTTTIDKQRRAGKPKTSHNSSLCQACHDGVCVDRK